ncbi:S8 family serine peptidase [Streptacidiphilus cavernicola]|uniref:S8 family serine peptidase n=1 Tax=Streptacidiphilus cavernicola TaxID=3342716 RepID=A0ABV6W0S4_9ACTN
MRRVFFLLCAFAVSGVLMFTTFVAAHADATRDKQWTLQVFKAQQRIWPLSIGKGVVVAVIDSGVRATHVDLDGQVLVGKNFATGGNGQHDISTDGHGTGVASLIAAHGHGPGGTEGIIGLAPGVKILPLAVDSESNSGSQQVADAIRYAVDQGAAVINVSLGGPGKSTTEESAVAYAESRDVILVAASGNDGVQVDNYPASFPGVISVGGADQNGTIWGGSDFGSHLVLVAPATGIVSDNMGSDTQYGIGDGTSYAAAYVSAAAALVRAKFPELTAGQVVNRLIKTAVDPNAKPGQTTPDLHYGYGVLRPDAALNTTLAAGPAAGPLPQTVDPLAGGGGAATAAAVGGKGAGAVAATPGGASGGLGVGAFAGIAAVAVLAVVGALVAFLRRRRRQAPS